MALLLSIGAFRLDADMHGADDHTGLAADDVVMAGHSRDGESRRRFLASRRAFRAVLGEATGFPPEDVPVRLDPAGGPGGYAAGVHFSVAHRGDHYVVGATTACSIGVDIVRIGAPPPPVLVERVLPPQARDEVTSLPPGAQPREFALWWCRIVAAVRACGAGLDDAARCLALAPQRTATVGDDLAVAVAALTGEPFGVEWHSGSRAGVQLAGVRG